jgi:hypothetical protein
MHMRLRHVSRARPRSGSIFLAQRLGKPAIHFVHASPCRVTRLFAQNHVSSAFLDASQRACARQQRTILFHHGLTVYYLGTALADGLLFFFFECVSYVYMNLSSCMNGVGVAERLNCGQ